MKLSQWFIIVGLVLALPAWGYAARNQWSRRPGATGRMFGGCAVFAAIIAVTMLAAYLTL